MKTAAATAIAAASLIVAVAVGTSALGSTGRGTHYTVHCASATGTWVVARAFPARQVERPDGRIRAIEHFKQSSPGGRCWISGPHQDRPAAPVANR